MSKNTQTSPVTPGERWPGESAKAFASFLIYRDLGRGRSIDRAYAVHREQNGRGSAAKSPPAPGFWNAWSKRFAWPARARAWDDWLDAERRAATSAETRKAQEKHLLQLRAGQNKLIQAVAKIDPDRLSPEQALRWTLELIKAERLVLGEPISVERVQHAGPDGGPVQHALASSFDPSPAFLAEVLAILKEQGAFADGGPAPGPGPAD